MKTSMNSQTTFLDNSINTYSTVIDTTVGKTESKNDQLFEVESKN